MSWYEDYLLENARVFVDGGIRAIKIQDETREPGPASVRTIARMSALGHAFRKAFPQIALGIIVQAHDAIAPIAIADAVNADFVRIKIFVGVAIGAEGLRNALGVETSDYRAAIQRTEIRILADVHDRTVYPLSEVPDHVAALWAEGMGADNLVMTGRSFAESLSRIAAARDAGVKRPILIGGGIDASNVASALKIADAVIVSTSLLKKARSESDRILWDRDAVDQLMQAIG